eukprot:1838741-Pyramimonas_sp.AAC.1
MAAQANQVRAFKRAAGTWCKVPWQYSAPVIMTPASEVGVRHGSEYLVAIDARVTGSKIPTKISEMMHLP